jgi:hypothetical protein
VSINTKTHSSQQPAGEGHGHEAVLALAYESSRKVCRQQESSGPPLPAEADGTDQITQTGTQLGVEPSPRDSIKALMHKLP